MNDALHSYRAKRNFQVTPEPSGARPGATPGLAFVVQKHWARRLHYDFRLELDGTLKSWAVPKGPSYDPQQRRMAVQVEDHPLDYRDFEGEIPAGEYGAGKVIVWDRGQWEPLGDPRRGLRDGKLVFDLHGQKLHGRWALVRMRGNNKGDQAWLLIKEKDGRERAAADYSVVDALPGSVGRARPAAALPEALEPALATLVDAPPQAAEDWLFEVKYDGYRLLARLEGTQVRLFTRNGKDWTDKLAALRAALARSGLPPGWYDGEIVLPDAGGRPDFGLLQAAFDGRATRDIVYYLFDAPYLAGQDLRALPLAERRARLQAVLADVDDPMLRLSAEIAAPPGQLLQAACRMGLEGVIGKRRAAPYQSRRTRDWIKLKCGQRQEFVIGGYTDPQGSRSGFGALLLGVHDAHGALRYAGNVGSGFDQRQLREIGARLRRLQRADSPFAGRQPAGARVHWVRPALVAEVSFGAWTRGGSLRHAVFQGLRADQAPLAIRRERAAHLEESMQGKLPPALKISHPERLVDAASGVRKIDLLRYYALVADLLLPHTRQRPLAMLRAPDGIAGELFFQKHADARRMPGLRQLPQALDPQHAPMVVLGSRRALLSAAQFNVIEFHTQNASGASYDKPNRIVFDLDPGQDVAWGRVQEAARLLHAFLAELGLPAFLKTSGGKGLHVVVPLRPYYDWDTVKDFSRRVVLHMADILPERFARKSGPRNRVGKIFIDYLRNGRGATTVAAWSARARPGLGVSVPLAWEELDAVSGGDQWTVRTIHARLALGNTPWAGYAKAACGLAPAMRKLP